MTLLFAFAAGFLAAVIVEAAFPESFVKLKMAGAAIVAALSGFWDKIEGLF